MEKKNKALVLLATAAILTGCAGSATHEVLTENMPSDHTMSCKEIDAQLMRAQIVIDGVNEDKADVSGADIMDGIIWFPFNLIAKHSNYSSALEAASKRVEKLNTIREEQKCESNQDASTLTSVAEELRSLNKLYKDGVLSEEEYTVAKQKLLNKI